MLRALCSLPVGYIGYFAKSNDSNGGDATGGQSQGLRSLKALRLLRLGKMVRLAKIMKMLQKYDRFAELKPVLAVATVFASVFLAAHLLACFWFLIGVQNQHVLGADGQPAMDLDTNQSFVIYVRCQRSYALCVSSSSAYTPWLCAGMGGLQICW